MTDMVVTLGPEYDEALQRALMLALRELGASVSKSDHAIGGSQEIISLKALLDGVQLDIESETYIGLTLKGEAQLVEQVAQRARDIYASR